MTRDALEHLLRAAAAITNERDFVGDRSQAVLGPVPQAPDALLISIEADLYPRDAAAKSDLIDGARALRKRRRPDYLPMLETTMRLGVSRQTVLQRVKRVELQALHVRCGRHKGLRIKAMDTQPGVVPWQCRVS